jgi:PQQ-like domain
MRRIGRGVAAGLAASALASGCGQAAGPPDAASLPPAAPASVPGSNFDWPLLGLNPQRTDATDQPTGITAGNARRLKRRSVDLPGTVDSSPIYLHDVSVQGKRRDVFVMTTTYGKTLAVDAATGRIQWVFTPSSYASYRGTYQITTSTPAADTDRAHVFAAAPDGRIYRLSLATGGETGGPGWPVTITRYPVREKITGAINVTGNHVIGATGGYIGDTPPYQGHVVVIDRQSGRILGIFNTLCANSHRLLYPPRDCPQSHGSVWARDAVQVEANGNLLFATGRGHADDHTYFGNSVLELAPDASWLIRYWTPPDANLRDANDVDVGSTGPVLTGRGTVVQSGKDSKIHVVVLGRPGYEVQTLPTPGGSQMIAGYPAVWHHGTQITLFATTSSGTAAYGVDSDGRLHQIWDNGTAGTSPVIAGGLVYIYDPGGALNIYLPTTGRLVVSLPAGGGHWNAPIIGGGRIALAQGDANDRRTSGTLNLYTLR